MRKLVSLALLIWFFIGSYLCLGFKNGVENADDYRSTTEVVFALPIGMALTLCVIARCLNVVTIGLPIYIKLTTYHQPDIKPLFCVYKTAESVPRAP